MKLTLFFLIFIVDLWFICSMKWGSFIIIVFYTLLDYGEEECVDYQKSHLYIEQ